MTYISAFLLFDDNYVIITTINYILSVPQL